MADVINPLSNKHYADLNKALAKLNEANILITNAADAGFDMDEQRQQAKALEDMIENIKRKFFPDRS